MTSPPDRRVTPSRDTIRSNILSALQLTASASMQRDYAARVPIANVPAEVLCGWEDSYWPGDPGFVAAFTAPELEALADYHGVWDEAADSAPTADLRVLQESEEWRRLAAAAERALAVLSSANDRTGRTVYEIDGRRFSTIEEFYAEVGRVLIPGAGWGHNLDAFNDILRGGFGTPEEGFTLRWVHHAISKDRLGYPETVRLLELQLARCDPSYRPRAAQELELARAGRGPTTFDWLVEIIRDHGPGGRQAEDRVDLVLA